MSATLAAAADLDTRKATLVVSEMFGPTFQGEGPWTGRLAVFLRLGRCNLDCAWCDTPYTWDWKGKNGTVYDPAVELTRMTVREVSTQIRDLMPRPSARVVISGGEPMLQRKGLEALVCELRSLMVPNIDIETNGTRPPIESDFLGLDAINYVISPKLPSSGVSWDHKWYETIDLYRERASLGHAALKFVIADEVDIEWADIIIDACEWDSSRVWLMPEGRTSAELDRNAQMVAAEALDMGANYSDRLHVRLWGDERGR